MFLNNHKLGQHRMYQRLIHHQHLLIKHSFVDRASLHQFLLNYTSPIVPCINSTLIDTILILKVNLKLIGKHISSRRPSASILECSYRKTCSRCVISLSSNTRRGSRVNTVASVSSISIIITCCSILTSYYLVAVTNTVIISIC